MDPCLHMLILQQLKTAIKQAVWNESQGSSKPTGRFAKFTPELGGMALSVHAHIWKKNVKMNSEGLMANYDKICTFQDFTLYSIFVW